MIERPPNQPPAMGEGSSLFGDAPELDLSRGRLDLALVRLRLRLAGRTLRDGWAVFMESRIGLLSLTPNPPMG